MFTHTNSGSYVYNMKLFRIINFLTFSGKKSHVCTNRLNNHLFHTYSFKHVLIYLMWYTCKCETFTKWCIKIQKEVVLMHIYVITFVCWLDKRHVGEDYISSLCSRYAHQKKVVHLSNDNHLRLSFDMGACLSDVNKYKRLYIETSFWLRWIRFCQFSR